MDNPNTVPLPADRKRQRRSSPPPWDRASKSQRRSPTQDTPHTVLQGGFEYSKVARHQESFAQQQTRRNQAQEAEQMREWVSKEDEFVLKQSKKKAHIRIKEGRAKPIDWLAVTLNVVDQTKDLLEDNGAESDVDVIDPAWVFEGLGMSESRELGKEIQSYLTLETNDQNREYWDALRVICQDHQERLALEGSQRRAGNSVSTDVDRLLAPKTAEELEALKAQVNNKLRSNEPIDVEYWEQLLKSINVYSAKAALNKVYKSVIDSRLAEYRRNQAMEAALAEQKLEAVLSRKSAASCAAQIIGYSQKLDPEPLLKLKPEDKALEALDERDFMANLAADRRRVQKLGYVPSKALQIDKSRPHSASQPSNVAPSTSSRFTAFANDDFSQATTALYEREVARGVQDNEEIFAGEEDVRSASKPQWAGKYRPRKPRYFNRVQMGYEWNKYNQTHYDHDNPPPKVVQGYKFNIFYPDLIDKTKAPTYRIERENGRRRGQSFAPAGEEDTCLIRFISGPPYEDLAFRIVDKEWDYSAKRERGFRSSFDKGILQLHFQFKKVYYRK
ncbi:MAG: hypothetical protein LQ338_002098 [Usnochroma carphineum]|nr:MAG: hypothetical protein LQ338_002098 [Usnochroma carphineum]